MSEQVPHPMEVLGAVVIVAVGATAIFLFLWLFVALILPG